MNDDDRCWQQDEQRLEAEAARRAQWAEGEARPCPVSPPPGPGESMVAAHDRSRRTSWRLPNSSTTRAA
jgi:hypothetical protein